MQLHSSGVQYKLHLCLSVTLELILKILELKLMVVIMIKDWNVMDLVCTCVTTLLLVLICLLLYFISVYPENCGSYHGPHSINCLITIWEEVGCKIKGLRYPGVLTNADANTLKIMNLRNVKANMESVKSAADGGNADQQLNCYGIAIPNTCDSHNGPHSVECLTSIWESKGCLSEGTKAPVKLNTAEKEALALLNLE
ncbi:uncharacterized protein LOC108950608 [Ciona intestinalis]